MKEKSSKKKSKSSYEDNKEKILYECRKTYYGGSLEDMLSDYKLRYNKKKEFIKDQKRIAKKIKKIIVKIKEEIRIKK